MNGTVLRSHALRERRGSTRSTNRIQNANTEIGAPGKSHVKNRTLRTQRVRHPGETHATREAYTVLGIAKVPALNYTFLLSIRITFSVH